MLHMEEQSGAGSANMQLFSPIIDGWAEINAKKQLFRPLHFYNSYHSFDFSINLLFL